MKIKERNRLLKTYGHWYKRADVNLDVCVYCGAQRQCLDHVPPLAWVESFDRSKEDNEFLLYPSCFKCNAWLSNRSLFSFDERLDFLYRKYTKEIDKLVGLWSEDDLEEMSPMFQDMIRKKMNCVKELIQAQRHVEHQLLHPREL